MNNIDLDTTNSDKEYNLAKVFINSNNYKASDIKAIDLSSLIQVIAAKYI